MLEQNFIIFNYGAITVLADRVQIGVIKLRCDKLVTQL